MDGPVDLTNCDREPIHIPGLVQSHGALLAFGEDGVLVHHSANAPALLGHVPPIGQALNPGVMDPEVEASLQYALTDTVRAGEPQEIAVDGRAVDVVYHRHAGRTIVEFETRDGQPPALHHFAVQAQRSLSRIQKTKGLEALLTAVTEEVERLTGFDRVMFYRFRHDQSGDVVREVKRPHLESFLGLRYPASDIPSQARRLYVLNPLRFIADVGSAPVPLVPDAGPGTSEPLDLSHAVLRSVSPIHIEYLTNMGVSASMSVSVVVEGSLWGLVACHHYDGPKWVPQTVRLSCQLLSEFASVLVAQELQAERTARVERSSAIRQQLVERINAGDDTVGALVADGLLQGLVGATGVAVLIDRRVRAEGSTPPVESIIEIVQSLKGAQASEVVQSDHLAEVFPSLDLGSVAGMMAVCFNPERGGWIVWFRDEEVETVRWAGDPDKAYSQGVHGDRLTPRGSFAEYLREVTGQSAPWSETERQVVELFRTQLQEVELQRAMELRRARDLMVAALSHDLRSPLSAIELSAVLLSDEGASPAPITDRISSSARRMQRLVDQMLDFSRLQSGMKLGSKPVEVALSDLVRDIVLETRAAYPGFDIELEQPSEVVAWVDPDRFAQVLSNLLSNARHHGEMGHPARVRVAGGGDDDLVVAVVNRGPEIPEHVVDNLFKPFKADRRDEGRNRGGLGLGLYIVSEIVREHQGTIRVDQGEGDIAFTVSIPAKPGSAP